MKTPENLALLRAAVAAQHTLWDAQGALERALCIQEMDKKTDALSESIQNLAAGGDAEQVGAAELGYVLEAVEEA